MANETENKLYGCWINRKGEMIPVENEDSHAEVALEKVLKNIPRFYSVYEIMMRLGFLRIVFMNDGSHLAEYNRKFGGTKHQMSWIKTAQICDAW